MFIVLCTIKSGTSKDKGNQQQNTAYNHSPLFVYLSTILFTKQSINQSVTMPIPSRRKTKQAKNKTKPLTLPNQHSSPTVQLQTQGSHHSLCHLPFPTSFCCFFVFLCLVYYILVWYPMFSIIVTFLSNPHVFFVFLSITNW